jgi:hypothetical protein
MTAVEWLIDWVNTNQYVISNELLEAFEQAKAMEKKQIENAHLSGLLHPLEMEATKQAEQYYNETYGKDSN